MKYIIALLLLLVPLVALRAAPPTLVNGIAVIVNDNIVTYKDVQNSIRDDLDALERRYASQPAVIEQKTRELQAARIEELVEYQLVLHEFKTVGYNLPESFIQNRINEDQKKYDNRLVLIKTLQSQGMTYESYRQKIRERTILELMFRQKVPSDPIISPAKIGTYYTENAEQFRLPDQVKLRMIVLTTQANESLSTVKMAKEIRTQVEGGADFAQMAKVYSSGSQASQGGDWGWVDRKTLREDLAKIAFTMKSGSHSDPIETAQGIYLMKVEEARPTHIRPLSEVHEAIEQTLKTGETKRLRKQWIDRLKSKAFIRYF